MKPGPKTRRTDEEKKAIKQVAQRRWMLRNLYGISLEEYDELVARSDNKCYVCDASPGKRRLNVDHCHETGIIRGLLCHGCNTAIGLMQDDPELLELAATYLRSTSS